MKTTPSTAQTPGDLLHDLQSLVTEAETMMASSVTEQSSEALETLRERFHAARERLAEFGGVAKEKVVAGAKCTDQAIRANPYQALIIAAGVGLLFGVLVGRRCN